MSALCVCGHPEEAHPERQAGTWASGYYTVQPCRATVRREREDGDDSWPCPCKNFKGASP